MSGRQRQGTPPAAGEARRQDEQLAPARESSAADGRPPADGVRPRLVQGPVGAHLRRLAVPMAFGFLALLMFQLVDTFFVGQLGTEELAAVGFTFPIGFLLMSLGIGLGVGTASVLSRAIGAGQMHDARRIATDALLLAVSVMAPLAALGLWSVDLLFGAMGASGRVLALVHDYMDVWYLGVTVLVVPMVANAAIRATGDTRAPAAIMGVAGVINLALDPLLIFGLAGFPRLEVRGAALATVISWGFACATALVLLSRREHLLDLSPRTPAAVWRSWRRILYVAVPASATQLVVPLSGAVITSIVARFGAPAVAAYGVGTRLDPIAMIGILSLASALPVFVGQNWGAGRPDRVRAAVRAALRFSLLWGGAAWLLLFAARGVIARAFNDDPQVIGILGAYLTLLPLSYGALGTSLLVTSSLNALNKPLHSATIAFGRMFGLYVPLAWLGSRVWGVRGVFVGGAAANAVAGVVSVLWIHRQLREQRH